MLPMKMGASQMLTTPKSCRIPPFYWSQARRAWMWPSEEPLVPVCTSSLLNTQLSSSKLSHDCWMIIPLVNYFLSWVWGMRSPFVWFNYSPEVVLMENWQMCKKRRMQTREWKSATSVGQTQQSRQHPQLLTLFSTHLFSSSLVFVSDMLQTI